MSNKLRQLKQGLPAAAAPPPTGVPAAPVDPITQAIDSLVGDALQRHREQLELLEQQRQQRAQLQDRTALRESFDLAADAYAQRQQAALGSMIDAAVTRALARLQPKHSGEPFRGEPAAPALPAFDTSPPPVHATEIQFVRDSAGKALAISVGGRQLLIERDAAGRPSRLVPE